MTTEPAPEPLPSYPDRAQIGGPMAATEPAPEPLSAGLRAAVERLKYWTDSGRRQCWCPPDWDHGYHTDACLVVQAAVAEYDLALATPSSVTPDLRAAASRFVFCDTPLSPDEAEAHRADIETALASVTPSEPGDKA